MYAVIVSTLCLTTIFSGASELFDGKTVDVIFKVKQVQVQQWSSTDIWIYQYQRPASGP